MMVSTRGRYALRVMVDLAEHADEGLIPLREVSERQSISEKYLENIVKTLVQSGLLEGVRGKGGGYRLACNPAECTVQDVLVLTEGSLAPVRCLKEGTSACEHAATCRTLPMWTRLDAMIEEFFCGYTIADLAESAQGCDGFVA